MGTAELVISDGSPPEQIVCVPDTVLDPVNSLTRMVKVAVSEHPLALVTVTETSSPSLRVNDGEAV